MGYRIPKPGSYTLPTSGSSLRIKKDNDSWVPDVFENLYEDVKDLSGIPRGLVAVGGMIGHDVKNIATGKWSDFKLDDFAGAVADDYKHTYGPLFSGDFGTFVKRVEKHPLGPILDVLTVLTAGAGAAAKGGKLAVKAGDSALGAKLAGVEHFASRVPGASRAGAELDAISAGGFGSKSGKLYRPKSTPLKGRADNGVELPLHSNPLKRVRQRGGAFVSNAAPNLPGFGAYSRGPRVLKKSARIEQGNLINRVGKVAGTDLAHKFSTHEEAALAIEASGMTADDWADFYTKQLDDLTKVKDGNPQALEAVRGGDKEDIVWAAENYEEIKNRLLHRIELAKAPETRAALEELASNPKSKVAKAAVAGRYVSDAGARLSSVKAQPSTYEKQLMEAAQPFLNLQGRGEGRYRPHTQLPAGKQKGRKTGAQFSKNPRVPDNLKENEGIAFKWALDDLSPAAVMRAYSDAARYSLARKNFLKMTSAFAARFDPTEDAVDSGKWVPLKEKEAVWGERIQSFLEDADVVFGDSPILEQMKADFKVAFSKRFGDGTYYVPAKVHKELVGEFSRANGLIKKFVDKPTAAWRAFVLQMRPAWITNNFIGNALLMMATHGLYGSVRGLFATLPGREMRKLLDEASGSLLESGIYRAENAAFRQAFGNGSIADRIARGAGKPAELMGRLNAAATDDLWRRAALYAELNAPARQLVKASGGRLSKRDAMSRLLDDDAVMDRAISKTMGDLVDFRDLSAFEKNAMRRMVPFYSWLKGMSERTGKIVLDDPDKALVGQVLAEYGIELNEEEFGKLPSYLRGALKAPAWMAKLIGEDPDSGDNPALITTQGMNPFQTPVDLLGIVSAFGGTPSAGENPLSQLNPLFKVPFEAVANKDMFSQFPLDQPWDEQRGYVPRMVQQGYLSSPQTQALAKLGFGPYQRKDKDGNLFRSALYDANKRSEGFRMFGVPVRGVHLDEARARALRDEETNG